MSIVQDSRNIRTRRIFLNAKMLLLYLLAFFWIGNLLVPALSYQTQGIVIGSSGVLSPNAPPPNSPMPPNYFAYTGYENPSNNLMSGASAHWEYKASALSSYLVVVDSSTNYATHSSEIKYMGSYSCKVVREGCGSSRRVAIIVKPSGIWFEECYQSGWYYIPSGYPYDPYVDHSYHYIGGDQREKTGGSEWYTDCAIRGWYPNEYWTFEHAHIPGDTIHDYEGWWCNVYADSYTWRQVPRGGVWEAIINPHEIPHDRWFRLETYVLRRADYTGEYTRWITDPYNPDPSERDTKIMFSVKNVRTVHTSGYHDVDWTVWKHYGSWVTAYYDEIYLYNYNAH